MSDYEFWKDLGNIFDAILNYQRKNVEFNNRFINPWIRLGNIFDRDDRHKEAIQAYRHATEIDPDNAQNWVDLGDAQFKTGAYDEAIMAYTRAVELDPKSGWPLSNLGLTLVTLGKCEDAIPLYLASIDLLTEDKDKAVSWNRLGNAYRKLNDYQNAFLAFQKADELDGENTGFSDQLDETTESNTMVAPEEVLAQMSMDQAGIDEASAGVIEEEKLETDAGAMDSAEIEVVEDRSDEPIQIAGSMETEVPENTEMETGKEPLPAWLVEENLRAEEEEEFSAEDAHQESKTVEESVSQAVEEIAAFSEVNRLEEPAIESVPKAQADGTFNTLTTSMEMVETYTEFIPTPTVNPSTLEDTQPIRVLKKESAAPAIREETVVGQSAQPEIQEEAGEAVQGNSAIEGSAPVAKSTAGRESSGAITTEAAYEEYLKDAVQPVSTLTDHVDEVRGIPVTKVSESGDVRIAMDTQNAHVWNELGNVYLNSGSCDDAIAAYSRAIELDRQFAWPYSNLALAYVQKGRFAESILLYQRSIELFELDKDKAVTWNRLGNVYRRLNDYANAIAAYQTADDLDPDNAKLSLRSHYGLLGNLYVESKSNYVL